MKKLIIIFLFLASLVIDHGCKKTTATTASPVQAAAIVNARKFFEAEVLPSSGTLAIGQQGGSMPFSKSPDWPKAYISKIGIDSVVVVPLQFDKLFYMRSTLSGGMYLISDASRLIIYKDATGTQRAEVVTFSPDSTYAKSGQKPFTGIVRSEDWQGHPLYAFLYANGSKPVLLSLLSSQSGTKPGASALEIALEICYTYEGYNYAVGHEDNGTYWTEDAGCELATASPALEDGGQQSSAAASTAPVYQSVASGAGGGGAPASKMVIASGTSIIGNIADYNKCFTNAPGTAYTYQVSLCVDQPVPGTRDPWGFSVAGSSSGSQVINVGHTFLVFTQSGPNGITTRNTGFYPKDYVSPISTSDAGQLNNDSQHSYDISLTVTLNNAQFFNMLSFVAGGNSETYDLNSNNCTSFALQAMYAAGVSITSSKGSWTGGGGYDPGDLGEDIRGMTLQSGMTRSTADPAHPNLGTCQ